MIIEIYVVLKSVTILIDIYRGYKTVHVVDFLFIYTILFIYL